MHNDLHHNCEETSIEVPLRLRRAGHRKPAWFRFGVVVILYVAANAQAQAVRVGPEIFVGPDPPPAGRQTRAAAPTVAVPGRTIELPPPTAAERSARSPDPSGVAPGPHEIGFGRDLARLRGSPVGTADLVWQDAADGSQVASLAIVSPGAGALRVDLELTSPPAALEVRFFDPGDPAGTVEAVPAAELRASRSADGVVRYWSPTVAGDDIGVEFRLPAGVPPKLVVSIARVSHLESHPAFPTHWTPECGHTDAACAADVLSDVARRSIAKYTYTTGDGRTGACTGTLLNDLDPTTQTPYFLTAQHCVSTEDRAASMEFYWFYEREVCGEPALKPFVRQGGGATLLASEGFVSGTDFALLRLNRAPPAGAGMAGWSSERLSRGNAVGGMHHPKGLRKKIFAGRVTGFSPFTSILYPTGDGSVTHIDITVQRDAIEGGSSGSALWRRIDGDDHVTGVLTGGSIWCNNQNMHFGRMDVFYPQVSEWIARTDSTISGFTLVDALDGSTVTALTDGAVVDLDSLSARSFNIEAHADSAPGSVRLVLDGPAPAARTANESPYLLFGTGGGSGLAPGSYVLTATPYAAAAGAGATGAALSVSLTVSGTAAASDMAVTSLAVVDGDDGGLLAVLASASAIRIPRAPGHPVAIRAATGGVGAVGSVGFSLTGATRLDATANAAPFEAAVAVPAGALEVTATPYGAADLGGAAGSPLSVDDVALSYLSPPVAGFALVDAHGAGPATDHAALMDGASVDLSTLPERRVNVRVAMAPGRAAGSLRVQLGGPRTADVLFEAVAADVFLFGEVAAGDADGQLLPNGTYTLTATAYEDGGGAGYAWPAVAVEFSVTSSYDAHASPVTGFGAVDAGGGAPDGDIAVITDGTTLDLSAVSGGAIAIRADLDDPRPVSAVVLELTGTKRARRHEWADGRSFSLYGEGGPDDYRGQLLPDGEYTVTATPYSAEPVVGPIAREGNVRLAGGPSPASGRVEVHHDGEWGTVCDEDWGPAEAQVVCRQLGFAGVHDSAGMGFGAGSGRIWLDRLACEGGERALADCPFPGWGAASCAHEQDVGVACVGAELPAFSASFTVAGGFDQASSPVQGFTVVDAHGGAPDAAVAAVADQDVVDLTGVPGGVASIRADVGDDPRGPLAGVRFDLEGPTRLARLDSGDAVHSLYGEAAPGDFLGEPLPNGDYRISATPQWVPAPLDGEAQWRDLRLVGGTQPDEGRIEIYHRGEWGSVCAGNWRVAEAAVACRQLGFVGLREGVADAPSAGAPARAWLRGLRCAGDESVLADCAFADWQRPACTGGLAGAICETAMPTRTTAFTVVGSSGGSIRPEVSIAAATATVDEGEPLLFALERTGPTAAALTVTVALGETGAVLAGRGTDVAVQFPAGQSTTTLSLPTLDDAFVELASTVTVSVLGYGTGPASVTVTDNDEPSFRVTVAPTVVHESYGSQDGTVRVAITNGVTFAARQAVALRIAGGTASAADVRLSPATLTLDARAAVATGGFVVLNDGAEEPSETATVVASLDGTDIGSATVTIPTNDTGRADDPQLRDLSLSGIDIGRFAPGRETYLGTAARDVAETVVTVRPQHIQADVRIADGSGWSQGTTRTVALAQGPNSIEVHVTAADGRASKTYTVTVGRLAYAGDIESLQAAGNHNPRGMWGDGEVLWVTDFFDSKLYAYRLADGSRLPARDIDTLHAAGNLFPTDAWSDGETIWVADDEAPRVYAYRLADGARVGGRELDLSVVGARANGVWGDGEIIWVMDGRQAMTYAFRLDDLSRATHLEFRITEPPGYDQWGLWSDGATFWFADFVERVAYALQGGVWTATADVSLSRNLYPTGLWSNGRTLWASEYYLGGAKLRGYALPVASANASLVRLKLSGADLGPFSPSDTGYEGSVAHSTSRPTLTATPAAGASVRIEPADADDAVAGHQVDLPAGSTDISIVVTAADWTTTRTYTLAVERVLGEQDATLGSLELSGVDIGAFAVETTAYAAEVGYEVSETVLTATPNASGASVTISDAGGNVPGPTGALALGVGTNVITVTVTAADGATTRTYTVTVTRQRPVAQDLVGLQSAGNSAPLGMWGDGEILWVTDYLDSKLYAYALADGSRLASRDIAAWDGVTRNAARYPTDVWSDGETAWVSDNERHGVYAYRLSDGARLASRDIALAAGNRKPNGVWGDGEILWVLDGTERHVYAYRLSDGARAAEREFALAVPVESAGQLSPLGLWSDGDVFYVVNWPGSTSDPTAYAYRGGVRVSESDVEGLANERASGVWSDGETLWVSESQRNVKLYAYALPAVSSHAALVLLRLAEGDLEAFSPTDTAYAATVAHGTTRATLTAHGVAGAALAYSAADADPATAGHQADLAVGANAIDVTVTAADGVTTRTYTVTVTRAATESDDATLSGLALSGIDIGTFSAATTSYAVSVDSIVSSTVLTATTNHAGASVVIADADGSTAAGTRTVSLAAGANAITATVTAEDGVTTVTYTVTVTRAAAVPLTASFEDVPASHDGTGAFGLRLRFSEALASGSAATLRSGAVAVANGTLSSVRKVNGDRAVWSIEAAPTGTEDVTVSVAAGAACAAGGVCTADGRQLSAGASATIAGPGVSVPSPSDDATLAALALSGIDIGTFAAGTTGYSTAVANAVTETTVTAAPNDAAASVTVTDANGGTSGTSRTVALAQGSNAITVVVTAADGVTTRTYRVTVDRARPPLTASFEDVPAAHDGELAFSFTLRFNEPILTSYRTLRDEYLEVVGGTARRARRVNGSDAQWSIEVQPSGAADVTVTLPSHASCASGVCTADGRPLSATVTATVPGPASSAPLLTDATVSGPLLTLSYDGALDGGSTPGPADFVVLSGSASDASLLPVTALLAVTAVRVTADTAVLTLARAVQMDEQVTVSYLVAPMHPLQDVRGRTAVPLTDVAVRNEMPAVKPVDAAAPGGETIAPPASVPVAVLAPPPDLSRWLADGGASAPFGRLHLSGRALPGVAALAGLTELRVLNLAATGIADLTPLSTLTGLAVLDLSSNAIADVGPLSRLTGLERLDLSGNRIVDVSALSGLTGLEVLLLDDNQVVDVVALSVLTELVHLGLSDNRIAEVGLLAELAALRRLDLTGNRVSEVSPLGDLSQLVWLRLPGNPITDAAPLGRLTRLRWLWLERAALNGGAGVRVFHADGTRRTE